MRGLFRLVFLACFAVMLFTASASADKGDAVEGRKLFATYCYLCHGLDGKGNGPLAGKFKTPLPDFTDTAVQGRRNNAELFAIIDGRESRRLVSEEMPKWGDYLTGNKIMALISYIRYIGASKNPMIGDPASGAYTYERYCSPCHGLKGKGNGVMLHMLSIKPTDHSNSSKMDPLTNEELVRIISNGIGKESLMPGWKDILSENEIKNLVGYIRLLSH